MKVFFRKLYLIVLKKSNNIEKKCKLVFHVHFEYRMGKICRSIVQSYCCYWMKTLFYLLCNLVKVSNSQSGSLLLMYCFASHIRSPILIYYCFCEHVSVRKLFLVVAAAAALPFLYPAALSRIQYLCKYCENKRPQMKIVFPTPICRLIEFHDIFF